jgi:hypothetical protein
MPEETGLLMKKGSPPLSAFLVLRLWPVRVIGFLGPHPAGPAFRPQAPLALAQASRAAERLRRSKDHQSHIPFALNAWQATPTRVCGLE